MAEGDTSYGVPYGNINGCSEAPEACLGSAYYNWDRLPQRSRARYRWQLVAGMAMVGAEMG